MAVWSEGWCCSPRSCKWCCYGDHWCLSKPGQAWETGNRGWGGEGEGRGGGISATIEFKHFVILCEIKADNAPWLQGAVSQQLACYRHPLSLQTSFWQISRKSSIKVWNTRAHTATYNIQSCVMNRPWPNTRLSLYELSLIVLQALLGRAAYDV